MKMKVNHFIITTLSF